jgi:hypothetical protein
LNGEEIGVNEGNMYVSCAVAAASLGISLMVNGIRREIRTDNIVSIEAEEKDLFDGIVVFLSDIERYEVVVTASSSTFSGLPENVLSWNSRISFWESHDKPNQWLVFDFGRFVVNCTSYIIQSADNGMTNVIQKVG